MMTRSLRLNLKLAYQLTQRMMICPSKCRPLNSASTGKNRCILSSSPDHGLFAPEREDFKQAFADLARPDIAGAVVSAVDRLVRPGFLGDLQVFNPFQRHHKLIFTPSPGDRCRRVKAVG